MNDENQILTVTLVANERIGSANPRLLSVFETLTRRKHTRFVNNLIPLEDILEDKKEGTIHFIYDSSDRYEASNYFSERFFERGITMDAFKSAILSLFPIRFWLSKYSIKKYLLGDLLSGITVSMMVIPQAMAYALIAQIPPIYGT